VTLHSRRHFDFAVEQPRTIEERFFDLSIDMLCVLGFNGYFRRLNSAWERTLGYTLDELSSRPFIEFVHPDDRARTLNQNGSVRGGGQALSFENRYLCKDGSFRWFRWNATPDPAQQVIYSVARDVTEAKQAEAERERLVAELTSALAEIKVLQDILPICSYCHKIRTDDDYWLTVEAYLAQHANTQFTHGICPDCMREHIDPQIARHTR
jgi:PAS domain S-box-containing protein